MDYLNSSHKCIINNCKKEREDAINKNKKLSDNIIKIVTNKKITEKDMLIKLNKNSKAIMENNKRIKLLDCQLKYCYPLMQKNIIQDIENNIKYYKEAKELIIILNEYYNKFKHNKITSKDYIEYSKKIKKYFDKKI